MMNFFVIFHIQKYIQSTFYILYLFIHIQLHITETVYTVSSLRASTCCLPALLSSSCYTASKLQHTEKRRKNVTQNDNRTITETIRFQQKKSSSPRPALGTSEPRSCLCRCLLLHRCLLLLCCLLPLLIMLLVIELGSDVMQNIVCNTKSIILVTVITIPCKTIRKKKKR